MSETTTTVAKRSGKRKHINLMRLAAKNFVGYFWINIKLAFVLACLSFMICLFSGYNSALQSRRNEIVQNTSSSRYLYCTTSLNKKPTEDNYQKLREYAEDDNLEIHQFLRLSVATFVNNHTGKVVKTATSRDFDVFVDGELVQPEDEAFKINCYSTQFEFHENDKEEMLSRFGTDELFVGRQPQTADEISLAETFLLNYGLDRNALGKNFCLKLKDTDVVFCEGTLVGSTVKEYFELTGHSNWSFNCFARITLWEGHPQFKGYSTYALIAYTDKHFSDEEMKSMLNTAYGYAGMEVMGTINDVDKILVLANTLYVVIGTALGVGLVLTVMLMMNKYISTFARASGIFMTFGMPRKKLNSLLFCQLFLLALVIVPMASVLSVAGYWVIGKVMYAATNVMMELSAGKLLSMLAVGLVVVAAISLLFFAFLAFRLRRKTIKELLLT